MSKQFEKYAAVIKSGTVTERDILNLKKLLNGWSNTSTTPEERKQLNDMIWDADGLKLTAEQTEKGINWLRNQWKTPRGVERLHNPFGYRETDVLENFSHFTFVGFYDDARVWNDNDKHNYQPIYDVFGKPDADGDTGCFQYYMARGSGYNGGSVEIIG